jgi:hypothetical protein
MTGMKGQCQRWMVLYGAVAQPPSTEMSSSTEMPSSTSMVMVDARVIVNQTPYYAPNAIRIHALARQINESVTAARRAWRIQVRR